MPHTIEHSSAAQSGSPLPSQAEPPAPAGVGPTPASVPGRFEDTVAAYEAADRASMSAPGGVLFYGSSSIRRWPRLTEAFPGIPVSNRGFGGSTAPEAILYAPRLVLPCKPGTIVYYEGDNDLPRGRTPEQVLADHQTFACLVHAVLPRTRIHFLAIKPSPRRRALLDTQKRANQLTRNWLVTAGDPRLGFVDVFAPMLNQAGEPRPELFGPDDLHMSDAGYAIWNARVGTCLGPTLCGDTTAPRG